MPGGFADSPHLTQQMEPVTTSDQLESVVEDTQPPVPRRSGRERRQAELGPGMVPNSQRYRAHAVIVEPSTLKQAMEVPDAELWKQAIEEEMDALHRSKTWEVVSRPKDHNVVGSKWVFKVKYKADGSVERYKARLVAKGFSQQPGTDYDDTYAPVARYDSLRLLLALAAHNGWTPRQLDVKSAFLYGKLDRKIYMEIPDGYKEPGKCYLLRKSIYGLKQSPLVWYDTLTTVLNEDGFTSTNFDPCVFVDHKKQTYLAVYVDDIMIFGRDHKNLDSLEDTLHSKFECTDLGTAHFILGIQVDVTKQGISLNQQTYITKVLERFGMLNCHPVGTPLDSGIQLRKGQPEDQIDDPTLYQSIIGSLMYACI
ncbi:hypothetical protein K3495_g15659, partial [Podosphaera aphanis]